MGHRVTREPAGDVHKKEGTWAKTVARQESRWGGWPAGLPVTRVRVARPTDRLDAVVRFYRDGLGLPVISSFHGHASYEGVILGLPGAFYHLEFTHHEQGSPCPAPSVDNLLVLYLTDPATRAALVGRLAVIGHQPVPPENLYWNGRGVTIEDGVA